MTISLQRLFLNEGGRLRDLVGEVIRSEVKQADDFAETLGVKPSHLSMAVNGNGRNFSLTWLPAVLHIDRERRVLKHVAGLVGCKVEEKRDLTPEQKLSAVLRKLKERGVDIEHLEREAYAEDDQGDTR